MKHAIKVFSLGLMLLSIALDTSVYSGSSQTSSGKDVRGAIEVGGQRRTFLVHLPPSYEQAAALPVMLAFHGGGGTGEGMRKLTLEKFDRLADREGFIVVYPDGLNRHWNDGRPEVNPRVDDVGFISELIKHFVEKYKADEGRIYATGISNGSFFSFRLACELSDRIAAIAPVAAPMGEVLSQRCSPTKPMPVLFIHGTEDPLVPWEGGDVGGFLGKRGRALSVSETVSFWVKHNGCRETPKVTYEPDRDPNDGTRVRKDEYNECKGGSEVILDTIEGGGHTWPGGWQYLPERIIGKTSRDISACEIIWEFFKEHAPRMEGK